MNQPQQPQPLRPVPPQQPGAPQQHRPVPAIPAQQTPRAIPAIPGQPRPAAPTVSTHGAGGNKVAGMPIQATPRGDDPSLDSISLVDDFDGSSDTPQPSKIKAFGVAGMHQERTWKRKPHATGQGACRVRSFHGRLSDEGMAYMDDKINEWLDGHPDIEVKVVTTTIGQYEGKIKEPALVVNVWY
jgi:hypothetical protein